jgi:hypothetical protein
MAMSGHTGRLARTVLLLASLLLAGCAGTVVPNIYADDPRFVAMVADLKPAMKRVADAENYRVFCIWAGNCRPILPRLLAGDAALSRRGVAAGFSEYHNVIVINLAVLRDHPQWYQRTVWAHEMGHWVKWRGSYCDKDLVACEQGADAESVKILTLGWGIPHPEAVEHVHRKLLGLALSWVGSAPKPEGHRDPKGRLQAFRKTFGCTDTSLRTCANGPVPDAPTAEGEHRGANQPRGDHHEN